MTSQAMEKLVSNGCGFNKEAKDTFAKVLKGSLPFDQIYDINGKCYRLHCKRIGASRYHVYVNGNCMVDYDFSARLAHFRAGVGGYPPFEDIKDVIYNDISLKFKELDFAVGRTF